MFRGVGRLLDYCLSVLKVACIFICALFMPRLFIHYISTMHAESAHNSPVFKLGLENVSDAMINDLKDQSIGLITNHTGKDQQGNRNIDILLKKGLRIVTIFTPKHGYNATGSEHHIKQENHDSITNLPILSWTENKTALSTIDVLLFDVQDSGMRQGYITTLLDVMKTAQAMNKKVIILDRPNMLGSYMEGSLETVVEKTAIDSIPVPIRHGMTVGELANYFNKYVLKTAVDLSVVPMEHYIRHGHVPATLAYQLSPNIMNKEACYGYSFLGLLGEIAPFDIGIGTDKSFQCLMLPDNQGISKQQWYQLQSLLKSYGVESKLYRCFNKRKHNYYTGLKLQIKDINSFSSFNTLLAILNFFKDEGVQLQFSPRFDVAVGNQKVRAFYEGTITRKELEQEFNNALTTFFTKAMNSFIYKPLPQVVRV